jgi:hypothetical protein
METIKMITEKLIKKIAKVDAELYESTRSYKVVNGLKVRYYASNLVTNLNEIKNNLESDPRLETYHINLYKNSSDDLVISVFHYNDVKNGLVDLSNNKLIQEAAYYIAEKRNFEPGDDQADWYAAKKQIDNTHG